MNGFALGLGLKRRLAAPRKWTIGPAILNLKSGEGPEDEVAQVFIAFKMAAGGGEKPLEKCCRYTPPKYPRIVQYFFT